MNVNSRMGFHTTELAEWRGYVASTLQTFISESTTHSIMANEPRQATELQGHVSLG